MKELTVRGPQIYLTKFAQLLKKKWRKLFILHTKLGKNFLCEHSLASILLHN